jgi:hypothetical protein
MSLTGKPALTTAAAVTNDGFWPDLALADLLNNYRIPSEYADGVITTGLTMALMQVNLKLAKVKDQLVLDSYATLSAYTTAHPEALGNKQVLAELYKHAVYSRAKAGLLMQFAAINRRPEADNQAKEGQNMETHWLDESQAAIAEFYRRFLPAEVMPSKANTLAVLI